MLRSTNRWKWLTLACVLAVGLIAFGPRAISRGIQKFVDFWKTDPYADLRPKTQDYSAPTITIPDVTFAMFDAGMKIGEGFIKELKVSRARDLLYFTEISKGRYFGKDGDFFNYSSRAGQYNKTAQQLTCTGEVHIQNKDMDLKTSDLTYLERTGVLEIQTPTTGTFHGGQVSMGHLKYGMKTGFYEANNVTWTGAIDSKEVQETQGQTKSKTWSFHYEQMISQKKNIAVATNIRGENGESIIIAPKVIRDTDAKTYTFPEGFKMFGKESNVTAPKATLYEKEKKIVMVDGVSLLIKPSNQKEAKEEPIEPLRPVVPESVSAGRPQAQKGKAQDPDLDVRGSSNRRKYPVKVFADTMTYFYKKGNRHALIEGHPQARQDFPDGGWRQVWCSHGFYDGEKETLRLEGPDANMVFMKNSIGDELHTPWLLLSTKEDDDSMSSGKGTGVFQNTDEDEDGTPTSSPPPPGGSGGTKPPLLPGILK